MFSQSDNESRGWLIIMNEQYTVYSSVRVAADSPVVRSEGISTRAEQVLVVLASRWFFCAVIPGFWDTMYIIYQFV